ncbi:hypothetical protein [Sporolactobacillus sp. KGMB 08714]|uniref:hypothetical protein n=1 Tax=Sporolactobacillus sp. KGMB 08714 TaxID=3064704 RepID=UPI002FBD6C51
MKNRKKVAALSSFMLGAVCVTSWSLVSFAKLINFQKSALFAEFVLVLVFLFYGLLVMAFTLTARSLLVSGEKHSVKELTGDVDKGARG